MFITNKVRYATESRYPFVFFQLTKIAYDNEKKKPEKQVVAIIHESCQNCDFKVTKVDIPKRNSYTKYEFAFSKTRCGKKFVTHNFQNHSPVFYLFDVTCEGSSVGQGCMV